MVPVITLHKSLGRGYANESAISTQLEIAGQRILLISESQTRIQDRSTNIYTQINLVGGATDQILSYTYLFLM